MRALYSLPFLFFHFFADAGLGDQKLSLRVMLDRPMYLVGEPVSLSLVYENSGDEPFYLDRSSDLGKDHLSISAELGECMYSVRPSHFDATVEGYRFFYVPLLEGDRLETHLPPINDLAGMEILDLKRAGEYRVTVAFTSRGEKHEGMIWPIWRGVAVSDVATLKIEAPPAKVVASWVERLSLCAQQAPCEDTRAVEYFRLVKSAEAKALLSYLFRRDHLFNPRLAEALANQLEPGQEGVLEEVAHGSELPRELRDYFQGLAVRVNSRSANCQ